MKISRFPVAALLVAVALSALYLGSCQPLAAARPLALRLPSCPAPWEGIRRERELSLRLSLVGLSGERREIASGLPFGACLMLDRPPEEWSVAVAEIEEVGASGQRLSPLRPAGALYPQECQDGELRLSFLTGWVGACELALADRAPGLCRAFNWQRLRREAAEKLDDPWRLSPESFALRASQGEWQSRGFCLPDGREVDVDLSALGLETASLESWCAQSPFTPQLSAVDHRLKINLDEGENLLFAGARALVIIVKTKEIQCFLE